MALSILASIAYIAAYILFLALVLRIAMEMIRSYARAYRPAGAALVAFEAVYSVTDPVVNPLRKALPPLRLGAVALDTSTLILFIVVSVLLRFLAPYVI